VRVGVSCLVYCFSGASAASNEKSGNAKKIVATKIDALLLCFQGLRVGREHRKTVRAKTNDLSLCRFDFGF
jgi:hypothetical protein